MADLTLSQQDYESLIALARKGATSVGEVRALDAFLKSIETKNNITRHGLWIQWQEVGKQVPITASFPTSWPPELRFYLELLSRPIAKSDVVAVLAKKAIKPLNVLVTPDPAGIVGWTTMESYFV